ncbi:plastocyanin/azurin family copper-binding protein [Paenibacillus monticola]|nr:plastocyanin/azurin family copper-binding protein [Paenibacillus monticola]
MKRFGHLLLLFSLMATLLMPVFAFAEAGPGQAGAAVKTDAQTAAELGLLSGDGNGINIAYLAKGSTRIQAAIISLRLQGKLDEATVFLGTTSFADSNLVGKSNQAILAYLHNHPEFGWSGAGANRFDPLAPISSQQLYKVLLEVLGFKSNVDFDYKNTEMFAASKGLTQIAGISKLTNAHIASALIETLSEQMSAGHILFDMLKEQGVVAASAALPAGERIELRTDSKLGTFFTNGEGRTLYYFSNDAQNLDACQGQCITNWPFLTSDQLQIPATLNATDFTKLTHADGTTQWMYKGWPLYTFVKDAKAGDTLGDGVNGVWFVVNPTEIKGTKAGQAMSQPSEASKTYHIDIKDYSFGSGPLTVEAGSTIIFTNFDDMQHNAVAVNGSFSLPLLSKGDTYTITLDKPGTYDYYCQPHKSFMTGQIIVK